MSGARPCRRAEMLILILVPAILGAIMWLAVSSRGAVASRAGTFPSLLHKLSGQKTTSFLGVQTLVPSAACFGHGGLYSPRHVEFLVTKENLAKLRPRSLRR